MSTALYSQYVSPNMSVLTCPAQTSIRHVWRIIITGSEDPIPENLARRIQRLAGVRVSIVLQNIAFQLWGNILCQNLHHLLQDFYSWVEVWRNVSKQTATFSLGQRLLWCAISSIEQEGRKYQIIGLIRKILKVSKLFYFWAGEEWRGPFVVVRPR